MKTCSLCIFFSATALRSVKVSRKKDHWAWHLCWSSEYHQFISADYQQEKFTPHWGCTHTVQPGSDLTISIKIIWNCRLYCMD